MVQATMKGAGEGSITKLRSGKFWARLPMRADGQRPSVGIWATWDEANAVIMTALAMQGSELGSAATTFAKFGREVFALREQDGYRDATKSLHAFEFHLANSPIASLTLPELQPVHVAELARWLSRKEAADKRGRRKISHTTVVRIMSLGSVVCAEAVQRGIMTTNPFAGIDVKKRADESAKDVWTFLTLEEQRRLVTCEKIPYADRLMFRVALGAGMREGELVHNYLRDVHLDGPEPFVLVRFGSRKAGVDLAPKNGKPRKVYLFGDALVALREWLELRKTYLRRPKGSRHEVRKDEGLIFPTVTGCRRGVGKFFGNGWKEAAHPRATDNGWVDRLAHYYELAGIPDRPGLHFHSLRHTCATSLLEGFWGPPWALEEVSQHLGHASIQVTQRYAHPSGVRLRAAAARSQAAGYALVTTTPGIDANSLSRLRDLNSRPTVYETLGQINHSKGLNGTDPPKRGPRNQLSTIHALARTFLDLVKSDQVESALAVGVTLATAALATPSGGCAVVEASLQSTG